MTGGSFSFTLLPHTTMTQHNEVMQNLHHFIMRCLRSVEMSDVYSILTSYFVIRADKWGVWEHLWVKCMKWLIISNSSPSVELMLCRHHWSSIILIPETSQGYSGALHWIDQHRILQLAWHGKLHDSTYLEHIEEQRILNLLDHTHVIWIRALVLCPNPVAHR